MKGDEKTTIITIMVGCIALYLMFSLAWLWIVALAVGVAGMFSPRLTKWIHVGWLWAAVKIGFVTSHLLLGAIFILILIPLALLSKVFRRDVMLLKDNHSSYFVTRSQMYERAHLENPW